MFSFFVGISPDDSIDDQAAVKSKLVLAYKSELESKVKSECDEEISSSFMIGNCNDNHEVGKWATTWYQQFSVLFERSLKEKKHKVFSKLKIFQVLVITLLSGLLWWKSNDLQDQVHT